MRADGHRPSAPGALAVDAGGSKADVVLLDRRGAVIGAARARGQSNVGVDTEGSYEIIGLAIAAACRQAGVEPGIRPVAPLGVYCLAGADLPSDDRRIARKLKARAWTDRDVVRNDTWAVLRAGTDRGWGVAVVCGAGMNCVARAPDGRTVRFPALGELSGDLAPGGEWVGRAALAAALRARDGRGPRTALERVVPARFGVSRPIAVMHAVRSGRLAWERLMDLCPVVFEAALAGDAVARSIVDQLADEIVAMGKAAIRRARLASSDADVVLGGGVFRAHDRAFASRISDGIRAVAPAANVRVLDRPPVLGAVLMALDELGGAPRTAATAVRGAVTYARMDADRHRTARAQTVRRRPRLAVEA